ncbi:MAG: hypothetical protein IT537_18150 [Hyphomicrobiales bacterium]|nr:hypothetical protein [Hyphomicrobiales bacterium]
MANMVARTVVSAAIDSPVRIAITRASLTTDSRAIGQIEDRPAVCLQTLDQVALPCVAEDLAREPDIAADQIIVGHRLWFLNSRVAIIAMFADIARVLLQQCQVSAKIVQNGNPGRMFQATFGQVERALLATYRVPPKLAAAFRARLTHLQRRGLFGADHMPGRGSTLAYGPDQLHRLVFVCEMMEFGISPSMVLSLVDAYWARRLHQIFSDAERAAEREPGDADVIMHLGGVHLLVDGLAGALPNVNSCRLAKLPSHLRMWMTMGPDDPSGLPPRALVVNLSMRLRAFHRHLAQAVTDSERRKASGGTRPKATKAKRRK